MPESLDNRLKQRTNFRSTRECWEWKGSITSHGYASIMVNGKRNQKVHRIIYQMLHGPISKQMFVCHTCDNRKCVNPDHLFLGTCADNMKDAAVKNRFRHKLSISDVNYIRYLYTEGFKQTDIAAMFSIGQDHVSRIINRKRRQHV